MAAKYLNGVWNIGSPCEGAYCWNLTYFGPYCTECLAYTTRGINKYLKDNNVMTNNVMTNNVMTNNVMTNNVMTNNVMTNMEKTNEQRDINLIDTVNSLNSAVVKAHGTVMSTSLLKKMSMLDFLTIYCAPNGIRFCNVESYNT